MRSAIFFSSEKSNANESIFYKHLHSGAADKSILRFTLWVVMWCDAYVAGARATLLNCAISDQKWNKVRFYVSLDSLSLSLSVSGHKNCSAQNANKHLAQCLHILFSMDVKSSVDTVNYVFWLLVWWLLLHFRNIYYSHTYIHVIFIHHEHEPLRRPLCASRALIFVDFLRHFTYESLWHSLAAPFFFQRKKSLSILWGHVVNNTWGKSSLVNIY